MLLGRIANINESRRWGYIKCPALARLMFFHRDQLLLADIDDSLLGRRVSFEFVRNERGGQAVNVTIED